MPDDYEVDYSRVRDEERLERDGTVTHSKLVTIYIGKHGPFTERFTPAEWSDGISVRQRVERLKTELRGLPK